MARILVVADRSKRAPLRGALQPHGHEVFEASDGPDALEALVRTRLDLVVSDIVMPTTDGCEFVRRLRGIPALSTTPVVFFAETYQEREARALASRCGAAAILTRPTAADRVVETINAALMSRAPAEPAPHETMARLDRIEAERDRLRSILDIAERIAAERDLSVMFNALCVEARRVVLAQQAWVDLLTHDGSPGELTYSSGLSGTLADTTDGSISSSLKVPIAASSRVYGWLNLRNKLGSSEFNHLDDRVAVTLGVHAGIAYEHALELRDAADRVRKEERKRLSRSLHDQMGQLLAGLKIDMELLVDQLPSASHISSAITDRAEAVLRGINDSIELVRTIARDLRPAVLDDLGFVAAIERQAHEFERQAGIRCHVTSTIDQILLTPDRSTAVLKIVQQALTNVLQHSGATRVTVALRQSRKALTVSVTDNGGGISDRDLSNQASLGLMGMRERAALLGGQLEVRRRDGRGTVVRLTIPLVSPKTARRRS
jgi:signal transduction histidine kinase